MTKQTRQAFNTGLKHQNAVATWARQRLADQGGAKFDDGTGNTKPKQIGCLFADGVGLGKTWEALAATALLLAKHHKNKSNSSNLTQRHVLILVPPGLVVKWSLELTNPNPDGFQTKLEAWAKQSYRSFVNATLSPKNCFTLRKKKDLVSLPPGSRNTGTYNLPAGTYVCNWNVFLSEGAHGNDRVNRLKKQLWDVVIVDEAHHKEARRALDKLTNAQNRLLLSATPFQLDMTEMHKLTKHLVVSGTTRYKVLKHGAVRDYAKAVDKAFDGGNLPTPKIRKNAEGVLGQLVAISNIGKQKRHYHVINESGGFCQIDAPFNLDETKLSGAFTQAIQPSEVFQKWYLQQRLAIAMPPKRKHVAVELQKNLSLATGCSQNPKLDALRLWARKQFKDDLKQTLKDGIPRKLLVFSRLKTDVVEPVADALRQEFIDAHRELCQEKEWKDARNRAAISLGNIFSSIREKSSDKQIEKMLGDFGTAINGTPFFDLLGKEEFAKRVERELLEFVSVKEHEEVSSDVERFRAQQQRIKRNTAKSVLQAIFQMPLSATFSGNDTRRERDAIAEAFKTALAPWILVATNVGSEGIDLHRYSQHLVHFDLEWNPARLEQREGRIDRLGRVLKEPARIYYLLVKDTYDERIFHQVIARQRWHGVLLGRKALQLDKDEDMVMDVRQLSKEDAANLSLNLDPRRR